MPLQKLLFKPGINRESTTYANEGGWFESDKIRFRSGHPEKIGGWTNLAAAVSGVAYTYAGVNRDMNNWVTLNYSNLNGIGTNQKYYIENGGVYKDVTPLTSTSPVSLASNPFTTTNGSKLVLVTASAHGISPGTWVTFSGATAVGGLTLNGEFETISTPTGNTLTIISPTAASSTATGGGAVVIANFQIAAGNATYSTGNGWGAGPWNAVVFGVGSSTLSSTITAAATSISVASTTSFSASGTIVIESEIITYTGLSGGITFTGCTRATDESMATIHLSGVTVQQYDSETSGTSANGWGDAASTANAIGAQLRLWTADDFGQDLIFAPRGGAIYYWAVDTSTYARAVTLTSLATAANATNGPYVPTTTLAVISSDVQRFVIAFGSNPYTPGNSATTFDPMIVRWSDQEDAYTWVPAATNQSGEYKLASGSTIITARTSKQEVLIWTDAALFSMQYLGPPYVWGFNLLMDNISIISPNAISSVNNQTFWMGVDKFYVYTGRVDTLPCTLRQYVFNDINQDQAYQIVSGTNEGYNEVWWMYPSLDSPVNNRYVIYNHLEQIWYYGNINRTAWLDSPLRQYPMGAFSVQNSYLDQPITASQLSITLLNGYSYPGSGTLLVDSEYISYTGHTQTDGNTIANCVRGANNPNTNVASTAATHVQYSPVTYNTPNQVMYHENGTDDGSLSVLQPIEAYIQSADFDIGDGHNFGFVWRMLPDLTFDGSTVAAPQVTLSVRSRQNSGTAYGAGNSPDVVSGNNYALSRNYVVQLFTGQVYTRIRGRQMAFKVISTDIGVAWQLGATRIDLRPDGRR